MLLRFLGTSAGELYPGIWCRCRNCQTARTGAPEDRRQSAALYVEPGAGAGVLIDLPSEIASQARRHGLDLPALQYLLVTHSHGDHWFPYLLRWRARPPAPLGEPGAPAPHEFGGPRFTELPVLHIWGNRAVEAVLRRELGEELAPFALEFHPAAPGDRFTAGAFQVTALRANHDVGREDALHYVLENGPSTLLYGLDGDTFLPETRQALRAFRFDRVILESTYGVGDGRNHRNFARLLEEARWFQDEGRMTDTGQIIAAHFSPHHCPPHSQTRDLLEPHGVVAAWDGMEVRA
jgi:phosphoribosyl 1,2-cyclic phosphate phosphodiesterase